MEASARKRGDAVVSVIYHMAAKDAAIVERMEKAWPLQMTAMTTFQLLGNSRPVELSARSVFVMSCFMMLLPFLLPSLVNNSKLWGNNAVKR
jgi:hypothetical protein